MGSYYSTCSFLCNNNLLYSFEFIRALLTGARLFMDPINILVGINLIATFGANAGGAKKGLHSSLTNVKEKPKTYLQNIPPNLAVLILVLIILSIFKVGTLDYEKYSNLWSVRIAGLISYIIFSWIQVWSYRTLGDFYSNDIVLMKNHQLVTKGPYRFIRHPLYLAQMFSDLGASVALLSYITLPLVILIEIPLLIIRALYEDKFLANAFHDKFADYKKRSGLLLPFIG